MGEEYCNIVPMHGNTGRFPNKLRRALAAILMIVPPHLINVLVLKPIERYISKLKEKVADTVNTEKTFKSILK